MTRVAVLASGRGSNFEAVLREVRAGKLDAEICALVSDRADARALVLAREAGIPALHISVPERVAGETDADRRTRHEELILAALAPLKPAFLILAGYMRILTPRLLGAFRSPRGYARVVNIHPSLLPAFPGTGGYAQAWEHGAKVAGASVHLVDEGVDEGPICAQEAFSIAECRSAEEVEKMGLAVEHRLYPRALSWILEEKFEIEKMKGRPCVRPS